MRMISEFLLVSFATLVTGCEPSTKDLYQRIAERSTENLELPSTIEESQNCSENAQSEIDGAKQAAEEAQRAVDGVNSSSGF